MEERTDLTSVSLPIIESDEALQPSSLLCILCTKVEHSATRNLLPVMGTPRLILCPDAPQYSVNTLWRARASLTLALASSRQSSAKSKCSLALFVKLSPDCKKTWTGFSKEALHDIINFIRLAVPSAVMVCLELWSVELVVLLSGLLPNPQLETSVLSISLNTISIVFMVPFGCGAAVSTRVSNELGAGRPQAARLAVRVVVFMAIAQGLVVGSTMVFVRKLWGYAYSNEEEVVNYVAVMMPILAASNIMDGVQCVLSGT
ncbi:protein DETOXIFICATION 16-like [Phoenix dactylifera]|uniref:Protein DETOXIFICATION 16-like n=1 Tax=Phoenix dactylifera TaxID=42345 RepID=A0A8B9AD96_PHODC|nr:protein DETOXIFICATION 16-like [Phoenix dactylifera]